MHTSFSESASTMQYGPLRRKIGIAMLIKILLLTGLWLLIFRWQDRPASTPDIASHFAMPGPSPALSLPQPKKSKHVR